MKIILIIATVLSLASCSFEKKQEGEIVKDKNGKYYELKGGNTLGDNRYQLIEIDTNKWHPKGF